MEFASRTGGGQAMEYGIGPGEGGGEMMGFRKETWPSFSEVGRKEVKDMQLAKPVGVEAGNWGSSHLISSVS